MELHESVTSPLYPLMGFTLITPSAPLPACTLLGATAVCTVIVNPGATDCTVRYACAVTVLGVAPEDVPVTVIKYSPGVAVPVLVTVFTMTVALAGGATEAGLTTHVGKTVIVSFEVAWHERSTVPLNPLSVPTVRLDVASPPGSTVPLPENVLICNVKPA